MPSCDSNASPKEPEVSVSDSITWIWEEEFNPAEQEKLKNWIEEVYSVTNRVLGPFPFAVSIHFYRRDNASEPVPWAHTRRLGAQSVHFHVDPSFSLKDFRSDWTAPHEISHLALPFLGRKNSWFAEGFATYMQNEVMETMGTMTEKEVEDKVKEKITYNQQFFEDKNEPFVEVSRDLVSQTHNYPAMYWGSVSFFVRMDQYLVQEKDSSLNEFIRKYQEVGRLKDQSINHVISTFDSMIGKPVCRQLMNLYTEVPANQVFEGLKL